MSSKCKHHKDDVSCSDCEDNMEQCNCFSCLASICSNCSFWFNKGCGELTVDKEDFVNE